MTDRPAGARLHRGRGATVSPDNRFSATTCQAVDDGWGSLDVPLEPLATTLTVDTSRGAGRPGISAVVMTMSCFLM